MKSYYDLYKNGKLDLSGVTCGEIAQRIGATPSYVSTYATKGLVLKGVYTLKRIGSSPQETTYDAKDFIRKFGIESYREWRCMNIRYGGGRASPEDFIEKFGEENYRVWKEMNRRYGKKVMV